MATIETELIEDTLDRIGHGMMRGSGMLAYDGHDVMRGATAIRELKAKIAELERKQ